MDLNYLSEEQEMRLSHKFKELAYSIQPSTLLKKGLHELKENIGIRNNVVRSGAGLALNLALNSLAKRNRILGGGLALFLAKNILSRLLKKKKSDKQ